MGTTSEKLTYLNETKQLLKENINSLGGNLTTEPFRQYASVLEGIYERIPKVSGIGSSLSLSPTMVGKIKLNEIYGNTLQDGTPTPDTPVEIQSVTGLQNIKVCGKNLINIPDGTYSHNGITAISSNGEITLNGTASGTSFIGINVGLSLQEGNYVLSNNNSETINDNSTYIRFDSDGNTICTFLAQNVSKAFTLSQNATYSQLVIRTTSGISFENFIIKPQLEQGSTATSYEPYKGNTYEVNLGKNLLPNLVNTQTLNGMTITKNEDGSLTFNGTANAGTNLNINYASDSYIHLESGKKYTASLTNNNGFYFRLAKVSGGNVVKFDTPNKQVTFTSNYTGDCFVYLTILNGTTFDNLTIYPQIELGDFTSYSPYFTPIELNKIGDFQDSIKKSTGKNLLDKDNYTIKDNTATWTPTETGGTFSNTGTWGNGVAWRYKLDTTKTYTLKANGFSNNVFCYIRTYTDNTYSTTKTSILNDGSGNISKTFTPDSEYVAILFRNSQATSNVEITNIQLEENSQATSYEPYLPKGTWYVEKQIGKVVLDGSEGWTFTSGTRERFTTSISDIALQPFDSSASIVAISNYFVGTTWYNLYNNTSLNNALSSHNSVHQINLRATQFNGSVDEFKTWLSTNKPELIYALTTSTYTEITNTELIEDLETLYTAKSQDGTTNISITSEDLEMILNVSALKGDVE